MDKPYVSAVIVAAGRSSRMGAPKQLLPLAGVPVLARTLLAFEAAPSVAELVVVAREQDIPRFESLGQQYGIQKPLRFVAGGETRQQSVANGVAACRQEGLVAIHDGARPLIAPETIEAVIQAAVEHGAAAAAVPMKDTVKVADKQGWIDHTPDRSRLWAVQTPQVFDIRRFAQALQQAGRAGLDFTDDCQLFEQAGYPVKLVEGRYSNLKITTPEDLALAEGLLQLSQQGQKGWGPMRIGHGYDVHRLVEGRRLMLGGVEIPYEKGLLGHSDADVLAHAVADAILGAAGLGDIGGLFPDTDPAFKDADSLQLLAQVAQKAARKGYTVANIDATLLAQAPKLKPYIEAMAANLARACGIPADRVNVKATTEEGLGFTGRGEGIAAHAVCLLTGP